MVIKIHSVENTIMRHDLMIMMITNDMSEDSVIRAKQMHQIAEIEARVANREAQVARFKVQIAEIERDLLKAMEAMNRCKRDKYAEVFAGRGIRVISLKDIEASGIFGDFERIMDNAPRPGDDPELDAEVESISVGTHSQH